LKRTRISWRDPEEGLNLFNFVITQQVQKADKI